MNFTEMSGTELKQQQAKLAKQFEACKAQGLKLNMARGKPAADQLGLSMEMLDSLNSKTNPVLADGTDCRNYGQPDGLPEMRQLFSGLMGVPASNILIGGNSSLNMMFDTISCGMTHGMPGGKPWCTEKRRKFLCPSPGYDRHFAVTEYFGFELIAVPMLATGPDMNVVENLVAADPAIKGMWCVPKYSNPTGITYSDETVRRIAALKPAAPDFRIFWDNAYCVHELTDTPDQLLNLWEACKAAGNPDLPFFFASTSKVTFPGAGVAAMGASDKNLEVMREYRHYQIIGPDKMNQLRHLLFLKKVGGVKAQMERQRALIAPKFQAVEKIFDEELAGKGVASWTNPRGGYFISVDVQPGCAKRTVALCKEAGVTLTGAGATFPCHIDPQDSNIRVAPTYPPLAEVKQAAKLFCLCAQLAVCEKLLHC
ncbi:MAG: aminotransferase class I/II-fold pyridoxal phosphate-dependent enzyme [Oscillospiraceae bacterium]|nr:aminotransferase class I/II-fold pyridoxal phosphate-dependent enzyme [Oscillospiraceae bacterium]